MREFVYYSRTAWTSGNFDLRNLMRAGRMDIACNVVIAALFLSHDIRKDTKLHLVFHGLPSTSKHLEFIYNKDMPISKKDIAGLIKRMLYKVKKDKKVEAFPGCFIEEKSFSKVLKELGEKKKIYVLDRKGRNIRELKNEELENCVFVLGDHEGLPKREIKKLERISVGNRTYFSSHTIVIVHNELDIRGI